MIKLICLTLLFVCNSSPSGAQQYVNFETILQKNVAFSGLQFSPDGRSLVFATTRVDWENNRRKTSYALYDVASKSTKELTFKERNVSQVRWSPSGKYLSYVALPDTAGATVSQLYLKDVETGKAKPITSSKSGIVSYDWSPKEDMVVYAARDEAPTKTGAQKFFTAFEVGNNSYTTTTPPLPTHLYLVELTAAPAHQITNGTGSESDINWIDDSTIVFIRRASAYTGDFTKAQVMFYKLGNEKVQPLASGFHTEVEPMISPDHSTIAFSHPRNNVAANLFDISMVGLRDKSKQNLTDALDQSITGAQWMPDGKSLLLAVANKSKIELVKLGLDKKITRLPLQDITGIGEFTVDGSGKVALTGSTMTSSAEIYLYDPSTKGLEKISSENSYLKEYTQGKTAHIEWPVTGGMIADGVVTYPPNFDKTRKYPLVLFIHGGPTAASFVTFSPVVQQMAANGWIVFQPNYRGSLNRGNKFQSAIANDAGFGPGEDIVKGIARLKQSGNIDEKKIAVTGWSYGGFMTAWLIGKYPNMWKAAVAGAAPVDLTDMTSLTDNNVSIRHAITSSPWKGDNFKKYMDMSPIIHLSRAKAPTLVMSVVGDERVSITGSYKIYHALKANDVPVQFIAYPGSGHFPADPVNQNDVYQRWIAWLKKYLD
jgi:dipeptidyl aminopeptidase/acylaminoacyl peptidase